MENYERLTLDLIGEGMTPKARYEQTQFLLGVYDILTGKTPCKHERITRVDGLDECLGLWC